MKTIEITVSPTGESQVETKGFSGSDCRMASQFLEKALGERSSETLTNEFYRTPSHTDIQNRETL